MPLPEAFIEEMKQLWQQYQISDSVVDFFAALNTEPERGLRANTLKLSPEKLIEIMGADYIDRKVSWSDDGFYLRQDSNPGKTAAYHAGLFYIQEPSAMLPAMVLTAKPGEKILDLCAAPGGKTARIAADLKGEGLLWANEISADRSKALLKNVELIGCCNCIITNETPERLEQNLPAFFDRILVDAPCSGSGMFRRDNNAAASWEKYGVEQCVPLQRDILKSADKMLKAGGYLVYSTCSFSLAENEAMINQFLSEHTDYEIIPVKGNYLSPGLPYNNNQELASTARIWPHITKGDGHYCALLQKRKENNVPYVIPDSTGKNTRKKPIKKTVVISDVEKALDIWKQWSDNILSKTGKEKMNRLFLNWKVRLHNDHLHLLPPETPELSGLKFVKTGIYLGSYKSINAGRKILFEAAHGWFLTMKSEDFKFCWQLDSEDSLLYKYLRGETLSVDQAFVVKNDQSEDIKAGDYLIICLDKYPVGYSKLQQQGNLKNLYPAAWRRRN